MSLDYIRLAPGFVREVLEIYESWKGKEAMPMKVKELMMVLQMEVSRRYVVEVRPHDSETPKVSQPKDTRLS